MAHRTVNVGPVGLAGAGDPAARAGARVQGGRLAALRRLEVRPRVVGPHARLGVVWFGAALAAMSAGRAALAVLLAPCAGLAAVQAGRSWRGRRRPAVPVAGAGAALVVVAAAVGPVAVAGVAAVLVVLVAVPARLAPGHHAEATLTLVIALGVGLAAASPVLLLASGLVPAFVLLGYASVYDAGAYVVGTGAGSAWEGPAAGLASIAAVTLAVAAVLVPPFRGASPWVLGGLAAVLAPLGPYAGAALLGNQRVRAPALRRLDSLLLLGPVWALAAVLLLD